MCMCERVYTYVCMCISVYVCSQSFPLTDMRCDLVLRCLDCCVMVRSVCMCEQTVAAHGMLSRLLSLDCSVPSHSLNWI